MINKIIKKDGNLSKLINSIEEHNRVTVFGFTKNEQISIFNDVADFILYVAPTVAKAHEAKESFEDLGKTCEIITEPFSYAYSEIKNIQAEKFLKIINSINSGKLEVLVVCSEVLLNKLPNSEVFKNNYFEINKNNKYNIMDLVKTLTSYNYKNQDLVESPSTFSKRGDILDVYPAFSKTPVRISFFDEEIEFIKPFDTATQLTSKVELPLVKITANLQNFLSDSQKHEIKKQIENEYSKLSGEQLSNLTEIYSSIFNRNNYNLTWLNVFNENTKESIISLLPKHSYVVFDEPKQIIDNLNNFLKNEHNNYLELLEEGKALKAHKNFYFNLQELFIFEKHLGLISFGNITTSNRIFAPEKVFNIKCGTLLNYVFNKNLLLYDAVQYYNQNYTQVIFAKDNEFAEFLKQKLLSAGVESSIVPTRNSVILNSVNLVTKTDNITFCVPEEKLLVVGTNKLLKKKPIIKTTTEDKISLTQLLPAVGDFVVHETHGIGKCISIEQLTVNNVTKDYIVLEYKQNDKLFLPVENIDVITKYVGGEQNPALNKLGGAEFYKTKQKVKGQLKETAIDLVNLYAERVNQTGIKFPIDDELQQAFEDEFSYTETPDQLKAINDVKEDMQSKKIMDRLICGDVGYGKTEVALRAIFKSVSAGYQVAFLCPTTILSQQHYNTCVSRMQSFGVNVEVLNRFKSSKEQKEIVNKINNGEINVICGTHRLLSKDIVFKNLGLLVLDEEQKFGVVDKEKIKTLKKHIDVLTLSATPIPRSLHMTLAGIRDISIIETPPPLKMPVITQVVEYRDELLKHAILNELDRDGQVLIVFNNIFNIYNFYAKVRQLVGEDVKVSVAHGQMTETELENEIYNLYNNVTQVLISTTLIENGIDLPTANTLIVINSDMLGLSQLYQLKGRVGRSSVQAFAYFTYDHTKMLNENAVKRLEAISEFTELGDGYKIAMKDLEIRGAGSVLGVKQHGHMQKVGYAMYINLLKEAIKEIKGEVVIKNYDFKIETDFSATLPNYYVSSTMERIKLYNKISNLKTSENMQDLINATTQIYGEVPTDVINLCHVALIKNLARHLPIKKIVLKNKECKIEFLQTEKVVEEGFLNAVKKFKNNVVINLNNLPIITINNFINLQQGFNLVIQIINCF